MKLIEEEFKEKVLQSTVPVLIDFRADWCGPCVRMDPVVKEIEYELGDTAAIYTVDVETQESLAEAMNVRSMPTFIIYKNGEETYRSSGVKTKEELIDLLISPSIA